MKYSFSLIFIGFLLVFATSCNKKSQETISAIEKDFGFLCESQKRYKETLSLKGVNQKELLDEYYQKIFEGLKTTVAQAMMTEALQKNPSERKDFFTSTAKKLGLDSWSCPFL
ncbi:MAG: hypothetical protein M9962_03140 [Oligoflexia bacterium]|nr:hypothetical protein [Oligoflexia bacterium]